MEFANKVAELAESEGHHPDIHISWNKVRLELSTHVIKGLSENDFILAAKIDALPR
jgi:4a-hydroxytetrahydrobiopterin dehydratase